MKQRAVIASVAKVAGIAAVVVVTWRAWGIPNEGVVMRPCMYYGAYCSFVVPFPPGHFHLVP